MCVWGGLYNKGVCLQLIIFSCKNTKGEARLARDVISRQLLTGLLNGTLLGLWGGEGNPAKDKWMRAGTATTLLSQRWEGIQARRGAPPQTGHPISRLGPSAELHLGAGHQISAGFFSSLLAKGGWGSRARVLSVLGLGSDSGSLRKLERRPSVPAGAGKTRFD